MNRQKSYQSNSAKLYLVATPIVEKKIIKEKMSLAEANELLDEQALDLLGTALDE